MNRKTIRSYQNKEEKLTDQKQYNPAVKIMTHFSELIMQIAVIVPFPFKKFTFQELDIFFEKCDAFY